MWSWDHPFDGKVSSALILVDAKSDEVVLVVDLQ